MNVTASDSDAQDERLRRPQVSGRNSPDPQWHSKRESESERIDDYENEVHFQNLNETEWVPRHIKLTA